MPSTISRLKSTDSLGQWADKVNLLIGSVENFLSSGGAFTSSNPTTSDQLVYDTGWKNKTLIGEVVIDTSYSNATQFKYKVDPTFVSNRTPITSVDSASDYLLIWDATDSTLKKVKPQYIGGTPGGSAGQVQYNLGGSTFIGATGFTFDGTRLSTPTLSVDTNTIYVDEVNNKVGFGNSNPGHTIDVTGSINASLNYRIGGAIVLSSSSLGTGITSSSLTSLGTISALNAGTGSFSGAVTALSLTTSNAVNAASAAISGNTTVGGTLATTGAATFSNNVDVTGTLGATGAVTFKSTLTTSGAVSIGSTLTSTGAATLNSTLNVASTTGIGGNVGIGGTLGATGAVTFGSTFTVNGSATMTNIGASGVVGFRHVFTNGGLNVGATGALAGEVRASNGAWIDGRGVQITKSLTVGATGPSSTTGEIRATNDIIAYYSSDAKFKDNVQAIPNALDKVKQIRGVTFDWNDAYIKDHGGEDGYFIRKRDVGVIAQELQKVLPELVVERSEGYLAVKYDRIVALLIEAVKELSDKLEERK